MLIPWDSVEPQTLQRLLSEIVTRDGTDYGAVERSTESKIQAALSALQSGAAELHWDQETETAALVSKDRVREQALAQERLRRQSGIGSDDADQ